MDAARLLPLLGALLVVVPVLMRGGQAPAPLLTADALIYFFAVWFGLVVASAVLSWLLAHGDGEP